MVIDTNIHRDLHFKQTMWDSNINANAPSSEPLQNSWPKKHNSPNPTASKDTTLRGCGQQPRTICCRFHSIKLYATHGPRMASNNVSMRARAWWSPRSKVSTAPPQCIFDRLNCNCFNNTAVLFSIHIMKCRGHVITSFRLPRMVKCNCAYAVILLLYMLHHLNRVSICSLCICVWLYALDTCDGYTAKGVEEV